MKNKFSFASIFYNDRFVLVFSVFLAIVLWFIMAIVNTEERAREISDVPVTVTLSESAQADGLRVFSQSVDKAKVYIKGDSFTVHNIQPENLKIVAEDVYKRQQFLTHGNTAVVPAAGNGLDFLKRRIHKKPLSLSERQIKNPSPTEQIFCQGRVKFPAVPP